MITLKKGATNHQKEKKYSHKSAELWVINLKNINNVRPRIKVLKAFHQNMFIFGG